MNDTVVEFHKHHELEWDRDNVQFVDEIEQFVVQFVVPVFNGKQVKSFESSIK